MKLTQPLGYFQRSVGFPSENTPNDVSGIQRTHRAELRLPFTTEVKLGHYLRLKRELTPVNAAVVIGNKCYANLSDEANESVLGLSIG